MTPGGGAGHDLGAMREAYGSRALTEEDLAPTWLEQLERWLEEAVAAGVREPNAMALATATAAAVPSARTVLLKGLDERGLVFFTNLRSRKGRELAENPRAAAVLSWLELHRQVSVQGPVEPIDAEESDAYFDSRPQGSRLAALASPQSAPIASRAELEDRVAAVSAERAGGAPTRPEWWGGLRLRPERVEFWQGRDDRLHDRLCFVRSDAGAWAVERLAP